MIFNPTERKLHLMENWLIILGILGEAELFSGIWRAKEKYFQGAGEIVFRDLGRSMHYFQGSREHRPPWGPQRCDFTGVGDWICAC